MSAEICVVVVGSVNMDLVVRSRQMPAPGETRMGDSLATVPGGKGANQAVAASRLGARTSMVGCVGTDEFGEALRTSMDEEKVSTRWLTSIQDVSSGVALIQVDEQGENAITVVPGANGRLSVSHVEEAKEVLESADVVLMQLEIPYATVARTIDICHNAGVLTVLDPAPAPDQEPPASFWQVDILSPNQHEAEILTDIRVVDFDTAVRAARLLQDRGVRNVVVKMGEAGACVLNERGEGIMVPAFPASVVDTTAAGDAFTAALGVGIARGMELTAAARFGCAAGSLAACAPGAQDAMPTRAAVEQLYQSPHAGGKPIP